MPTIFLPAVSSGQPSTNPVTNRVVVDPITRIEGHLRIEAQIADGVVDAWSAGTMFRGIEPILVGRDPRDAWVFTQRICGVCTSVHAIASVRAVENALGISIPDNARLVRNLIEAAQYVQDHVIHFYHLHALDWVDIVSALAASPAATGALARSISDWPNASADYFAAVQARVKGFVESGQLGLFANGYWGHPAYRLPPEGNLLAVAHYLEALDWQREFVKIHALLGGKNPHPQTYLVGGTALPVDAASADAINPTRIARLRALVTQGLAFVSKVYLPDLLLIASFYKDWAAIGAGPGNYLASGDLPEDAGDASPLSFPAGVILNRDIGAAPLPVDLGLIKEYVTRSWYSYTEGDHVAKHPSDGETTPNYTGPTLPYDYLDLDGKYSWLKTPRYDDLPMEVGPLARTLVAYAAGRPRIRELVQQVLDGLGLGPGALFSTLGRVAARGIETQYIAEKMSGWVDQLEANMSSGNLAIHDRRLWDPATWPAEASGLGTTEAPRGTLSHWVRIRNGKIENYQTVVPSMWNGSPRDHMGVRGTWEEVLIGTPVANPEEPIEILRTIHSFDPCMACAVHVVDATGRRRGAVNVSAHPR